ncbi:MAG: hypothetical protein OK455_06560 [Thaumarchaeota archaeon]|nr:hypothetical protein [Nitrososphaerota archaeon]
MSSEEKLVPPENKRNLKPAFASLIDAMRDTRRMQEREEKIRETEETYKRQVAALDGLQKEFADAVLSRQNTLGEELTADLEKQVSSLSLVAIDLARKKIEVRYSTELAENQLSLETERTSTFKSIEAFLVTLPFALLDKAISLKLLNKVYSASVRYNCADDIQFEFALDCKKSALLNKEFTLTSPEGEIKIPVSLGKSRFKKDPAPDYEGLNHYVLSVAELTEAQLITKYEYPEKSGTIIIVKSKRDSHTSLTVEYKSPEAKISVTSEPTLNKFLDSEQIDKASEVLQQSILYLEDHKIALVKLTSDGKVVFEAGKLDMPQFLAKAWRIIEPEVKAALSEGGSAQGGLAPDREDALSPTFVRQKIVALGESGNTLLTSLSLS